MKRKKPVLRAEFKWFRYLSETGNDGNGFPSAGPDPCIAGMRRVYGDNANLVMCCRYLFNVDWLTYCRVRDS